MSAAIASVDISGTQPAVVKKVIRRRVAKTATVPAAVEAVETATATVVAAVAAETTESVATPPLSTPTAIDHEIVDLPETTTETVTETTTETTTATTTTTTEVPKKKTLKGANKERLFNEFENLSKNLEEHFTKNNMKSTLKELKSVRDMTYRLLKLKTVERSKRDSNNSGFMKPVRVSGELEAFLKKDNTYKPDLTRAYLTTVLCNYIKTHNLQNPADKRIIFPDEELKKLFSASGDNEPLTYYTLQKRIQVHIFKN
jgi:chromatin remodeling complex protein RSC6